MTDTDAAAIEKAIEAALEAVLKKLKLADVSLMDISTAKNAAAKAARRKLQPAIE